MQITHAGKRPSVHSDAWVAPDATVCGDVSIGAGARVLHGARIIGEGGGTIRIGDECIVMENAVVRASVRHPCTVGNNCLIGPNVHLVGATIEDQVFVATGAAIFHGAHIGRGSEVRINAVVHIRTRLEAGSMVPIGWVAVGDPAEILPPNEHDKIWAIQAPLNFPEWVYNVPRDTENVMVEITRGISRRLGSHRRDGVDAEN